MSDTLLLFIAVFINGVIAGLFVCSTMIERASLAFDGPQWVDYKQAKERVFGPIMPPFFGLSVLLTIVSSVMLPMHAAFGIASALMVASGVVTGVIHVPLNKKINSWSAATPPSDWSAARARWLNWNLVRTVPAVLAFAIVLWAAIR